MNSLAFLTTQLDYNNLQNEDQGHFFVLKQIRKTVTEIMNEPLKRYLNLF